MLNLNQAIELVKKHDHNLGIKAVSDFCNFLGYTEREFYNIVGTFYNSKIFTKTNGTWILINDIT